MILYMLNKLDSQLTNAQLSGFFISNDYTDYFTLQQTLSDLVESKFVEKITIRNTSYYSITPEGYESLTFFKNQIPKGALEDMNQYLDNNKYALKMRSVHRPITINTPAATTSPTVRSWKESLCSTRSTLLSLAKKRQQRSAATGGAIPKNYMGRS